LTLLGSRKFCPNAAKVPIAWVMPENWMIYAGFPKERGFKQTE